MAFAKNRLAAISLGIFLLASASPALVAQQPNKRLPSSTTNRPARAARPDANNRQPSISARKPSPVQRASAEYAHTIAPGATGAPLEPIPLDPAQYTLSQGCDSCGMEEQCCCNPFGYLLDWSRADLWIGTTSFTNPGGFLTTGSSANGQVEGNFGFQEGFNFGSRLPSLLGGQIGAQLGMRFTQSQIDGTAAGTDNRSQTFLTGGLFRRVDYGLQAGLVVDYLHDDWVYKADLLQIRGEVSFLLSPCHELGFRFTDNQQVDAIDVMVSGIANPIAIELAAMNTYRVFARYRFGERGRGLAELQVGATEDSGTLLAGLLKTPLQNQLGLETSATYLIPPKNAMHSYTQEGWNIGIALVWTPGRVFGTKRDYYRPLLEVADNGTLLTRRLP